MRMRSNEIKLAIIKITTYACVLACKLFYASVCPLYPSHARFQNY